MNGKEDVEGVKMNIVLHDTYLGEGIMESRRWIFHDN